MNLSGFTGPDCEENSDDCAGHQCQNGGTCQDGLGTYSCLCPEAWTGESCKPSPEHLRPRWSAPGLPSLQGSQLQLLSPSHPTLQVGIALKMWMNVRLLVPLAAEMVVRAKTRLAASTACV